MSSPKILPTASSMVAHAQSPCLPSLFPSGRSVPEVWERVVVPVCLWLSTPLCQNLFSLSTVCVFSERRCRPGLAIQAHVSHSANSLSEGGWPGESYNQLLAFPFPLDPSLYRGMTLCVAFLGHQKSPSLLRCTALTSLL